MEQVLLSREDISKRWGVTMQTVINYENNGIITRIPSIPTPRYRLKEILDVEGTNISEMSPLERRKLETENKQLKEENEQLKFQLHKFAVLGTESLKFFNINRE